MRTESMSNRTKLAEAALGVVAGVGIALLFFVWAVPEFRYPPLSQVRPQRQQAPAIQPPIRQKTDPIEAPCQAGVDDRSSDLCAQWKAADAAQESAKWTMWGVSVGALTLLAAVGAAWFAGAAANYTRKGVAEAKRSADAAMVAVKIARRGNADTIKVAKDANSLAVRQFESRYKPWLSVRVGGPYVDQSAGGDALRQFEENEAGRQINFKIVVQVKNIGEMPANIVAFNIGTHDHADLGVWSSQSQSEGWYELNKDEFIFLVDRGRRITAESRPELSEIYCGMFRLTSENRQTFFDGFPAIVGTIDYLDPLGKRWRLGFSFRPTAAWSADWVRWGEGEYNYDILVG
ncbi:hypothetical protein BQ8794_10153 [Mesorhizobium prunaredense]|uniref:Uncharacterized protein n=1 Tax=Mesorhizobium prunaredense TaxID=1631249 RepID=A0A1R3V254_9HYPH|nr:hypothetical protein [Mesorhizobium prunaredense]SIT52783.1 hypothetical protein BQ8794_10153 [Mesorhizobium prunaredense]